MFFANAFAVRNSSQDTMTPECCLCTGEKYPSNNDLVQWPLRKVMTPVMIQPSGLALYLFINCHKQFPCMFGRLPTVSG